MTEFAKPEDHRQSSGMGGSAEQQQNHNNHHHHVNGMSNGHNGGESSTVATSSSSGGGGSGSDKPHKSSSSSSGHKSSSSSSGHKSSSKDKHRDKERSSSSSHKSSSSSSHKSSSKDKHRDKDRSSSSSSSRDHKSSSSSSDKDRERDKDKDRHKSSSSSSGEHKKDRDKERDKDRHKSSSSGSGSKSSSSSSSKDHKSSSSSSSSSRDHKSSSSSSHHSSSSSSSKKRDHKDKERSRDKDKDRRSDEERRKSKTHDSSMPPPAQPVSVVDAPAPMPQNHSMAPTNGHRSEDSFNGSGSGSILNSSNYDQELFTPQVKVERMDVSTTSSCDYSLSQFQNDEQSFTIKSEQKWGQEQEDDNEDEDEEEQPSQNTTHRTEAEDEEDDDEDVPLFKRKRVGEVKQEKGKKAKIKREASDDDEDDQDYAAVKNEPEDDDDEEDVPLTARKKIKSEKKAAKKEAKKEKKKSKRDMAMDSEEEDDDEAPKKKKVKKEKQQQQQKQQPTKAQVKAEPESPTKGGRQQKKKGDEAEEEVWKWWEEEKRDDGVKWNTLEHRGPVFAPDYEPLPKNVRFEYDGRTLELSQDAEEIATFYARMLDHDYTSKKAFNDNFFKDWRKSMTSKERELIKDLSKCNFRMMAAYFTAQSEANKSRSKEEKLRLKEANEAMVKEYGFCIIDGHKEKIGNFKIEPPGLFRGRGEHPKMGHLKRRVVPEDIILNCSKGSAVPKPPPGHKWKEVRHDNTVTWLASWIENVQGQVKYIMLNPSSRLKGEKDWAKYETARRLDKTIDKIRATYRDEWKSKEMRIRQRAVALYFIDKLALRAGNEKDEDQADTVGCCSLRVEHIALHRELNGKENVVVFDFLGKDSIRYYNEVEVEKRVFKNLELFQENKKPGDDLFDRLNTTVMNEHLRELMDGLTAKVFRTYNASITLQRQLDELTEVDATVPEKLLQYNRANRAVAILCNHQRAVPKTHTKSMENLKEKIRAKKDAIKECEAELKAANKEAKRGSTKDRLLADKKKKQLERLQEQLQKLEIQETDKDENKTIALGTSKLNYLDPRISVAWCKKFKVPIEKIFNKTQRDKFRWAIDMAGADYRF